MLFIKYHINKFSPPLLLNQPDLLEILPFSLCSANLDDITSTPFLLLFFSFLLFCLLNTPWMKRGSTLTRLPEIFAANREKKKKGKIKREDCVFCLCKVVCEYVVVFVVQVMYEQVVGNWVVYVQGGSEDFYAVKARHLFLSRSTLASHLFFPRVSLWIASVASLARGIIARFSTWLLLFAAFLTRSFLSFDFFTGSAFAPWTALWRDSLSSSN